MAEFEEKPRKPIFLYLFIVILIVAIIGIYFVFFAPEQTGEGFLAKFLPFLKVKKEDFSLVPKELKKDPTGGLIKVDLDTEFLKSPLFQSLKDYGQLVEVTLPGRANPFAPYSQSKK